jgi:hypothetical protein
MSDITTDYVKRCAHFFRLYDKREGGGRARRSPKVCEARVGHTLHDAPWLQLEHPQAFANPVHAFQRGKL